MFIISEQKVTKGLLSWYFDTAKYSARKLIYIPYNFDKPNYSKDYFLTITKMLIITINIIKEMKGAAAAVRI